MLPPALNRRREDIEHQTILALKRVRPEAVSDGARRRHDLRRSVTVLISVSHTGPGFRFPGRHEPVGTAHRRTVGNPAENLYAVVDDSTHLTRGCVYNRSLGFG